MIEPTSAIEVFRENLDRTNMLIEVMERNKGYNFIYQQDAYGVHPDYGELVKNSQNEQHSRIENSCAEHAIISLSTLFETYCKELVQELLCEFPSYFQHKKKTALTQKINELIIGKNKNDHEAVSMKLKLHNRFKYIEFFELYGIDFLTRNEKDLIEYIYVYRNCFVHNAGKIDKKTQLKLEKLVSPVKETSIVTISKRLRTKMKVLIPKLHERVMRQISST